MRAHLQIRVVVTSLISVLLAVAFGAAIQSRELAVTSDEAISSRVALLDLIDAIDKTLDEALSDTEYQKRLTGFSERLEELDLSAADAAELRPVLDALHDIIEAHDKPRDRAAAEMQLREDMGKIAGAVRRRLRSAAEGLSAQGYLGATALLLVGVLALVVGANLLRALRVGFLERLQEIERGCIEIERGDHVRRFSIDGDHELARVARAMNGVLDRLDRDTATLRGRNREVRALLVALLAEWPRPAAVTGVDGELLVSTMSESEEERLRRLTPDVRKAAGVLLSRGFVSAAELSTEVTFDDKSRVQIRALVLGEQRVVGWLAQFVQRGRPPSAS